MEITQKLDQLAELQSALDAWNIEKTDRLNALIPAKIKIQMAEVERELAPKLANISGDIEALTAEIKADVLQHGSTVKGKYLMATWNKGRAGGWDSAKLEGFALVHPEILKAKKPDGEPTVSFRAVK